MPWVIVVFVGGASAGLMAVSVAMNFIFGSSFGRTMLESYAYGAAFAFADIPKAAAPIVAARSIANGVANKSVGSEGCESSHHQLPGLGG